MLRFGRQRQRREERAHLVTMEGKKDAFRKYLEGAGVIDSITKGRGETSGAQRVRSEAREPGGGEGRRPLRSPSLRRGARDLRPPRTTTLAQFVTRAMSADPISLSIPSALVSLYKEPDKPVSGLE